MITIRIQMMVVGREEELFDKSWDTLFATDVIGAKFNIHAYNVMQIQDTVLKNRDDEGFLRNLEIKGLRNRFSPSIPLYKWAHT